MKVKKFLKVIAVLVVIAAIIFLLIKIFAHHPVEVVPGWQKLESVDGIIPKGAIVVVAECSNLIFPGNDEMREKTGFAKQGVIIFNEKDYCVSEGSIWVFIPEKYEVLTKLNDFLPQCNEKLSDLVGEQTVAEDIYFN